MTVDAPITTRGAVSPMAREMARIVPVKMPGMALGRTCDTLLLARTLALPAFAGAPDDLAGTWELDLEASSDPVPVLDRMGANFLIKHAAKSVRPTHVIIAGNGRFSLTIKSLIVTRRYLVVLDDNTKTDDDFFGHPFA